MTFQSILPDPSIALFVKTIMVFEENEDKGETVLPFFADGLPGLMYQDTQNGLWVNPHNKQMPKLFVYGQTLKPIELVVKGKYRLIVFQLYPFVLNSFFDIQPNELNDDCYNLEQMKNNIGHDLNTQLNHSQSIEEKVSDISKFITSLFENKQKELDSAIINAVNKIINAKGQVNIKTLYNSLHLTERTFERRFLNSVGITAKQFSKIIQFQHSYEQLTVKDYSKLTDIVYANGFTDQSHFIKVFKAFTGKTPLAFQSQK